MPAANLESLDHLRCLQNAAVRLGQLLEHAGTFADQVPADVWESISQAGAEIAVAGKALSEAGRKPAS